MIQKQDKDIIRKPINVTHNINRLIKEKPHDHLYRFKIKAFDKIQHPFLKIHPFLTAN